MEQKPTVVLLGFLPKKRRTFTLSEAAAATGIDRRKLLRVLEKFAKEGFLQIIDEACVWPRPGETGPCRRDPRYKVIKSITERKRKTRPLCGRDKIWRTIRFLVRFKISDLTRLSVCNQRTVRDYTHQLVVHGHLKELGRNAREKVFLLLNDPGPKRPIIPGE
jgi:Fic family protein